MKDFAYIILGLLLLALKYLYKPIISVFIAYTWCHINPYQSYDWLDGLWHGFNMFGNFILSIFTDTMVKSSNGSLGYNISWWLFASSQLITLILCILYWVGSAKSDNTNEEKE